MITFEKPDSKMTTQIAITSIREHSTKEDFFSYLCEGCSIAGNTF
jgi:hypothetical protein